MRDHPAHLKRIGIAGISCTMSFARLKGALEPLINKPSSLHLARVIGLSGVLIASRLLNPDALPEMCLFKMLTGIPCMFCGLGHAFHAISMGQFTEAIEYHPLAFVAYGLVVFHLVMALLRAIDRRSRLPEVPIKTNTMLLGTFGFFTLVWIIRLVLGGN